MCGYVVQHMLKYGNDFKPQCVIVKKQYIYFSIEFNFNSVYLFMLETYIHANNYKNAKETAYVVGKTKRQKDGQ